MTLHMTVGLPRSGKSTWARAQGWPIVSPDAIRLAMHGSRYIQRAEPLVWVHARLMVMALFEAGHENVVLDATSITRERRDEWVGDWDRRCVLFQLSSAVCIRRARHDGRDDLVPVIERMAEKLTWPIVGHEGCEVTGAVVDQDLRGGMR